MDNDLKTHGYIIGIFGLWVVISGIIGFGTGFMFWSNLISGAVIGTTGYFLAEGKINAGMFVLFFGFWIFFTSAVPGFESGSLQMWNNIILGGLSTIFGFASLTVEATLPAYELGEEPKTKSNR